MLFTSSTWSKSRVGISPERQGVKNISSGSKRFLGKKIYLNLILKSLLEGKTKCLSLSRNNVRAYENVLLFWKLHYCTLYTKLILINFATTLSFDSSSSQSQNVVAISHFWVEHQLFGILWSFCYVGDGIMGHFSQPQWSWLFLR